MSAASSTVQGCTDRFAAAACGEQRRGDEVLARRDRVDGRKERGGLARRGQRDATVEDVARRDFGKCLVHPLHELGVERPHEAAPGQAENGSQLRHAAGHRAHRHPGRALDLDDVPKRRAIPVEHLLELRNAVLAELGRDDELLDLAPGEGAHRQPLRAENHVLVVEDDGLAVAREANVELDRVRAEGSRRSRSSQSCSRGPAAGRRGGRRSRSGGALSSRSSRRHYARIGGRNPRPHRVGPAAVVPWGQAPPPRHARIRRRPPRSRPGRSRSRPSGPAPRSRAGR